MPTGAQLLPRSYSPSMPPGTPLPGCRRSRRAGCLQMARQMGVFLVLFWSHLWHRCRKKERSFSSRPGPFFHQPPCSPAVSRVSTHLFPAATRRAAGGAVETQRSISADRWPEGRNDLFQAPPPLLGAKTRHRAADFAGLTDFSAVKWGPWCSETVAYHKKSTNGKVSHPEHLLTTRRP